MINNGGIRFLLLNKGQNFSGKTKLPLKYTHDLLKLKFQTWDSDEILLPEDLTCFIWRESEITQKLHNRARCLLTFA